MDKVLDNPFLSIVLPAYNEEKRLGFTLEKLNDYFSGKQYSTELIVVDDGSRDRTSQVAAEYSKTIPNITIFRNSANRGKGYSVRRGILEARGKFTGFMDSDYKTPIEEIEKFLPVLEEGFDVVIGSRARPDSKIEIPQPLYRRWGSKLFALIMHTTVGLHDVSDTQCGFKFFSRTASLDIFNLQRVDGFMFDVEILSLAQKMGYKIREIPIRWMNEPDSRFQVVRGSFRNMRELMWIRLNLLRMGKKRFPQKRS